MSPNAAEVIRIAKGDRKFGVLYPHSTNRFLASDGGWDYVTVDYEDEAWRKYGEGDNGVGGKIVKGVLTFTNFLRQKQLPANTPIPGSKRWLAQKR